MPTYPYRCSACEHEWEEVASIKAPPTEFCPKCGAKMAQRLISKSTFVLKPGGCGWSDQSYAGKRKGQV